MKSCTKCKIEKDDSEFYPNKITQTGLNSWCKQCQKEYNRFAHNSPHYIAYRKTPGFVRRAKARRVKWLYGITIEEYNKLVEQQMGLCAICGDKMVEPHLDHDHVTNKIRGFLCQSCNLMIGHSKDNIKILESAVRYLGGKKPDLTNVEWPITDNFIGLE